MGHSADRKIVELEFDSEQFNKNVKDTIAAVKKAGDMSVTGEKAEASVKKLSTTLRENASSALSSGLEAFRSGLYSVGEKVLTVVKTLGEKSFTLAKRTVQVFSVSALAVGGLAVTGGTKRAMNLEHANFQLKGLLKDSKRVEAVMNDVNKSVLGTAYGLDEAAVVASQFAASEIKASEEHGLMLEALRGVAGVAAMGGAEYSRVGQIFTTVAGQGRLMGDQLLQLSTMGLNIPSTLKDYLNEIEHTTSHTEQEIRDMVSAGKIDFETFAKAMDWAFGEHATKANETFSGALSNLKAALSRVGAEFAMPTLENLRKNFLTVIPVVDTFKNAMKPLVGLYKDIAGRGTQAIIEFLKPWERFEEQDGKKVRVLPYAEALSEYTKTMATYLHTIDYQGERVFKALFDQFSDRFNIKDHALKDIFDIDDAQYAVFAKNVKFFADSLIGVINYLGSARNYFIDALLTVVEDAFPAFQYFAETFGPNIRTIVVQVIKTRFAPMFGAMSHAFGSGLLITSVGGFKDSGYAFSAFIESISRLFSAELEEAVLRFSRDLADLVKELGSVGRGLLLGFSEIIKGFLTGFVDAAPGNFDLASSAMSKFILTVSEKQYGERLRRLGVSIGDRFRNLASKSAGFGKDNVFTRAAAKVNRFFESIEAFFNDSSLGPHLMELSRKFCENVAEGPRAVPEDYKNMTERLFGWLPDAIKSLPAHLSELFNKRIDWQNKLIEKVGLDFGDLMGLISSITLFLSGIISKDLLTTVKDNWLKFISALKTLDFSVLLKPLEDVKKVVKDFAASMVIGIKVSQVGKIGSAIGLAIVALWLLATNVKTIGLGVGAISGLIFGMTASFTILMDAIKVLPAGQIASLGPSFMGLALGMLVLTAAIKIFGSMKPTVLGQGFAVAGGLILAITMALKALSELGPSVIASATSIWVVSSAVALLAITVALFGGMSITSLIASFSTLTVVLMGLTGALTLMSSMSSVAFEAAGSFLIVSLAMGVLSAALLLLGSLTQGELAMGVGGFAASMTVLVFGLTAFAIPEVGQAAQVMMVVAESILVLSVALMLLSTLSFDALAIMFLSLIAGIAAFAIAALALRPILPALFAFAEVLLFFGAATAAMGAAMLLMIMTLSFIASNGPSGVFLIINTIAMAVSGIIGVLPQAATALVNLIIIVLYYIIESTTSLANALSTLLQLLLIKLLASMPLIRLQGAQTISSFLAGVRSGIPAALKTGLEFIQVVCTELLNAIPWLVTSGATLLITGMNSAASFIRSNHAAIYDAGKNLFFAILDAIRGALTSFIDGVADFFSDVSEKFSDSQGLFDDTGDQLGSEAADSLLKSEAPLATAAGTFAEELSLSMKESIDNADVSAFSESSAGFSSGIASINLNNTASTALKKTVAKAKKSSMFSSSAKTDASAVKTGFSSGMQNMPAAASSEASSIAAGISGLASSARSDGHSSGSFFGSGLYNGIDRCIRPIAQKAAELVRKSKKEKVDKKQEAASPSRYTTRLGVGVGDIIDDSILKAMHSLSVKTTHFSRIHGTPFLFASGFSYTDLERWDDRPAITAVLDFEQISSNSVQPGASFLQANNRIARLFQQDFKKADTNSFEIRFNGTDDPMAKAMVLELATLVKARTAIMEA